MKEKLIAAALLQLIKVLAGSKLMKEVIELVRAMMNVQCLTGVQKKTLVTAELNDVKNEFFDIVQDMSNWIVSAAIDISYAYLVTRK